MKIKDIGEALLRFLITVVVTLIISAGPMPY